MAKPIAHGREIAPTPGMHPVQSLDFDQVQVQTQVAPLTRDNMQAFLAAETARIRQLVGIRDSHAPRKAIVVVDASNDLLPPPEVRIIQAEWLKRNEDLLRLVLHGVTIVVANPLLRGAMTAVLWMANKPCSMRTHRTLNEAVDWAIEECTSIGGSVSDELLRGRAEAVEARRVKVLAMQVRVGLTA